jgi:Lysylphosphatidylglycerol synthase TM region
MKRSMKATALRLLLLSLMAAIVTWLLSRVDWESTQHYLRAMGLRALLVLVPWAFVVSCDTLGWQASFEAPERVSWLRLYVIRVATDALSNSLPAGMAVGETLKALLLRRVFGLDITEAAANVAVSKFALALAQALFLVLGVALSTRELALHSQALIGRPGLEWFGALIALIFLAIVIVAVVLAQRAVLSRVLARLHVVARGKWRARLARWEQPIERIDHGLAVLARVPTRQVARSVAFFLLGWVCLGLENWVILALLTSSISPANAISMEAVVSIVRIAFFFIPSAFGAQEVSYYALFKVYDVPGAEDVMAAFMLTKRAKEACWIATGYIVLSFLPARMSEVRAATH